MSSLGIALKYIRMAALQAQIPVLAETTVIPYSDDPAVNLERAAALLASEADLMKREAAAHNPKKEILV